MGGVSRCAAAAPDRTLSADRLQSREIRVVQRKFIAVMSNKMTSRALSKFAQRGALLAP
jgi:hypothetical protein